MLVFILGLQAFLLDSAIYRLPEMKYTSLHDSSWEDGSERLNGSRLEIDKKHMANSDVAESSRNTVADGSEHSSYVACDLFGNRAHARGSASPE